MGNDSDWVMVLEESKISAFRKSNVNAVVPDSVYPGHSNVIAGSISFRFKGDVKTVLREVLGVDIPDSSTPLQR
jgi:hypothetical protein